MSGVVLCTGPGETGVLIGREPSVYRILVCAGPSKVGVLVCLRLYCVQGSIEAGVLVCTWS